MEALFNVASTNIKRKPQISRWTESEKREITETVLFWLEYPAKEDVLVEFLQNRAIRVHYAGLPDLHWSDTTYERFGYMLKQSNVRRVWFG